MKDLLSSGYFGVDAIPPEKDSAGNVTITHAATGYEPGQAITVNTLGGFLNSAYNVGIGGGSTRGGTSLAQGFILLHELGHVTKSLRPDKGHQDLVDQNDRDLAKNCKKLVKALRGR